MKATTRICSIVVLICAARLVCTAQQRYNTNDAVGYPLDYADTKLIQNDYLLEKRNKPSLSIVNPLDVLRKRLLLEMARRQMKENTRQVELNRAILKNVGKRMLPAQAQQQQQQLEYLLNRTPYHQPTYSYNTPLQLQQLLQPHYTNQMEYSPDVSIYDYVQRPAYMYDSILPAIDLVGSESVGEAARHTPWYINALEMDATDGDTTTYKAVANEMTNEMANDKKNSNGAADGNRGTAQWAGGKDAGSSSSNSNVDAVGKSDALTKNLSGNEHRTAKVGNLLVDGEQVEGNDGNADYQLRYFYGLHKKHHNMRK
ncbi:uncharacterized protein LOC129250003 [Anastrepha obliqua]|uniref:uncharacterized protein LOC129250003 n=1 Tax=Anastrepha obliqua TaxID=95512 RepID=UPI002409E0F7|nr:uncharacterized protein LOC129250003 [Anastrepha obliqua]XP_054745634.1 uncharacterized protein LOC129250003 [Anastrepha obliqua]